ncbi:MAG TPA: hypothetical protein VNQ50_03715 [Xanthobacteraceae bacterium]|nr:hypothetical protein [Xanthobacteraceae bacterium]
MTAILSWLASFLGGPVITGIIDGYKAKLAAGNDADKIAADLAGRELDVQAREIEAQKAIRIAEIGKWYEPDKLIGYAVAFIVLKVLVWDICLGLGSTPEPKGWIASITNTVVMFYFGKRGFENVARIIRR